MKRYISLCVCLCFTAMLAACGGGSSSDTFSSTGNNLPGTVASNSGVLVDPYISGAILQEVSADRSVVWQRQSSATDTQGNFAFPNNFREGSIVEIKIANRGTHVGAAYTGILKRTIEPGTSGSIVVSPLTTLVANGSSKAEVIDMLAGVGLTGLTSADIDANPMNGIENATSTLNATQLKRLQAAIIVNNTLEAAGDFLLKSTDLQNGPNQAVLQAMTDSITGTLSQASFDQVRNQLAGDPSAAGLNFGDQIHAVVEQNRALISQIKNDLTQNGSVDSAGAATTIGDFLATLISDTRLQCVQRTNPGGGNGNGGGTGDSVAGQAVFENSCSLCHNIGNGGLMDLSGKGALVAAKIAAGHNNRSLTATELLDLAAYLDSTTPPTTPPGSGGGTVDGTTLYANYCAGCHGTLANTTKPGRTAAQIQSAIDNNIGSMGILGSLTAADVQAIADVLPAPPVVDPGTPPNGTALYGTECAGCHGTLANTTKPGRTAAQIQSAIDNNIGNMGFLNTLTAAEVQAIADVLPAPPVVDPGTPPDGAALYASDCAGCHGALANTTKPGRTAAQIQSAIDNNVGNMGFLGSLTTAEVQAIADVLPAPPVVDPGTPPDGAALYASDCAGCHGALANTTKPGRTAAQIQSAIDSNVGNMGFLGSLTAAEVQAIADVLPAPPVVDPGTPPDGAALYASDCAGCHGTLANTTKPGRTAAQIQSAIDNNVGNMGFLNTLTAAEVQAIADVLPAGNGGPDYSDCTACHGQPPNGTSFPNTRGAHAVHQALSGVGTNCSICHQNAGHNGNVDLGFPAAYNAKSGPATDNLDGTCSNIICHGGQRTPDWWTGTINVNTDCNSCHTRGTTQYNSQNSGQHGRSEHRNRACTDCHNTAKMTNHFGNLTTTSFEANPAATIGGGSTRVGSYSNGTCSNIACHGSERW